jgi:hypothetical protein
VTTLARVFHHGGANILVCRENATHLADKNVCPTEQVGACLPCVVKDAGYPKILRNFTRISASMTTR